MEYLFSLKQTLLNKHKHNPSVIIALPYILRKRDYKWLNDFTDNLNLADGVLIRNLEAYGYLKEISYAGKIYADAGFYVWNTETGRMFNHLDGLCMPLELSGKEKNFLAEAGVEQIVYGHIPMMVTANCIAKTAANCHRNEKEKNADAYGFSLIDRMGKELPVYTNCKHCYNVIYNSVVLSLHDKVKQGIRTSVRLNLTIEDKDKSLDILNYYHSIFEKCNDHAYLRCPVTEYTTGHEKKGAL